MKFWVERALTPGLILNSFSCLREIPGSRTNSLQSDWISLDVSPCRSDAKTGRRSDRPGNRRVLQTLLDADRFVGDRSERRRNLTRRFCRGAAPRAWTPHPESLRLRRLIARESSPTTDSPNQLPANFPTGKESSQNPRPLSGERAK